MNETMKLPITDQLQDGIEARGLAWGLGPPAGESREGMRLTYTADELAAMLGVSTWSIYNSVKSGDCPVAPVRVGRRLVWPKAKVDALVLGAG